MIENMWLKQLALAFANSFPNPNMVTSPFKKNQNGDGQNANPSASERWGSGSHRGYINLRYAVSTYSDSATVV